MSHQICTLAHSCYSKTPDNQLTSSRTNIPKIINLSLLSLTFARLVPLLVISSAAICYFPWSFSISLSSCVNLVQSREIDNVQNMSYALSLIRVASIGIFVVAESSFPCEYYYSIMTFITAASSFPCEYYYSTMAYL